jgi:catechol 2,3-dioxygenase-like lactoylglutathione lyase family enzyme
MAVAFNHTIVNARDPEVSARFLSEILGLPAPVRFGWFWVVQLENGVSLDCIGSKEAIEPQHYAFLISEPEFDLIFGRIRARGLEHWADPARKQPGEVNHHFGGRGVYFCDPDGHFLEIITQPYAIGSPAS